MRLYVGNFPYSTDERGLKELFEAFGVVSDCKIILDQDTGRSKGFGFIELDHADAARAIEGLNNYDYGGRKLVVNEARPKPEREHNGHHDRGNRRGQRR